MQTLVKLCHDFAAGANQDAVLEILKLIIESKRYEVAKELVDYVKEAKMKALVLAKCGCFGEALIFARAAGDEGLQREIMDRMAAATKEGN